MVEIKLLGKENPVLKNKKIITVSICHQNLFLTFRLHFTSLSNQYELCYLQRRGLHANQVSTKSLISVICQFEHGTITHHRMSCPKFLYDSARGQKSQLFSFVLFAQSSNKQSRKTSSLAVHSLWSCFPVMLRLSQAVRAELNSLHVNEPLPHHELRRTVSHYNQ